MRISWSKRDKEEWSGMLLPYFQVYRNWPKKEFVLSVWMKKDSKPRHIKVDSIHQGKIIAAKMLKMLEETK